MKIMLDMDGVLTDYDSWLDYHNARKENGKTNWGKVGKIGSSFWSNMPWNLEGHKLYNLILDYIKDKPNIQLGIHSAIGMECGKVGKRYWLERNCPEISMDLVKLDNDGHFKYRTGAFDEILVDDRLPNIESYVAAGFPGVLFTNAQETFEGIVKIIDDYKKRPDYKEILRLLKKERECVIRAEHCDRNCAKCDLVEDPEAVIAMYDKVIEAYSKLVEV